MGRYRLYDVAKVLRSKNSGPFEITLDVIFDDPGIYRQIKEKNVINKKMIAGLYHVKDDMVSNVVYFDAALGVKATFSRKISSGTCFDRDVYGAQQHAPLMDYTVELDL